MKRCVLWLSAAVVLLGQPRAAYILPDIGAPGMAVAVDIIAWHDARGTFGSDGLYANEPGDPVRVECARLEDTARITLGPLVVSWEGRLISTHVFVHPWVRPNSWRWTELQPEFRIPLRVVVGGQSVVVDTFYIVEPTPIGVYTGTERVLGEGALGIRSRRGALVVDSLILPAGATFRVSTADCDPWTPGNQGYLPCVLMARGPIRGGAGTTLSVSAEGINAGPGGGGGGGSFCDVLTGSARGSNGGSGFTSGGRGGKNGVGVGSNEYRDYGQSTGAAGASLNGVAPGTSPQYESAGGGTGHPFGLSGQGCRDGNTCTPEGGYGGGSGFQQRQAGGAGGYATRGQSSGANNGGYEHGNACLVPLAGGSGGASGNPQGINVCSGSGGGGGGALQIVAPIVQGLRLLAEGAPGELPGTSQAGAGGGGSGGALHICAPGGYELPPLSVAGGRVAGAPSGGAGRVRLDGPERSPASVQPPEATRFVGPSIALLPPLPRQRAVVSGTGNGQPIVLYGKPYGGRWRPLDTLFGYGVRWSTLVALPEPDTLFFLVALQQIPNPSSSLYAAEPPWVLSPAAARLLLVARVPRLVAPASRQLDTVLCAETELWDTVTVRNTGDAPLEILSAGFQRGTQGFRLVTPPASQFPLSVLPGDSLRLVVAFQAPASMGVFQDTLLLVHTDTLDAGSPWSIAYRAIKDTVAFQLTDGTAPVRWLDFGTLCPGEEREGRVVVSNTSGRPLRFAPPRLLGGAVWSVTPGTAFSLPPGGSQEIRLRCRAGFVGSLQGKLVVSSAECPIADTIALTVVGLQTHLQWYGSGQFGFVRVGSRSELSVSLRNVGYSTAQVLAVSGIAPPFELVNVSSPLPALLAPQQELEFRFRYTPTAARLDVAEIVAIAVRADSACPDTARLLLSGTGVRVELQVRPSALDFGLVSRCEMPLDTVWLVNTGTVPLSLVRPAQVVGPHATEFIVVVQPAVPAAIPPGDSVFFVVQLRSQGQLGTRSAQLVVQTSDSLEPFITVGLRAEVVSPFVAMPAALDVGTLRRGQSRQAMVEGRNLLLRPLTVQAVQSSHPDVTVMPQAVTIPASGTQLFTITLTPQRLGLLQAELRFLVSEPCLDTHRVVVRAMVTGEGVTYTSLLDFGTVAFCQERSDTVVIANGTADTLWLLAAQLRGADAAAFVVELPPLPFGVAPGEEARLAVFFRPQGLPDGLKQAQLELTARQGLEPMALTVQLVGRRETPLLGAPPQISFGTVLVGASAQQPVTLTNRGNVAVRVDGIQLQSGQAFAVLSPPVFPVMLAPGESLVLAVAFRPVQPGRVADTLRLLIGDPCREERVLLLEGIGVFPVTVTVWFPELEAPPWAQQYRIPLRLESSAPVPGQRWAEMELAYDGDLFILRGVSRGRIVRQSRSGSLVQVVVRVEGLTLPGDSVVTELIGDVLLGSQEESPLRVLSFLWDDGLLSGQTQRRDGRLRLVGICREGGPRLLRPVGQTRLLVHSDGDELQLVTEAGERGTYVLQICSLEGRCLPVARWQEREAGMHQRRWVVPNLPAGVYVVRFQTPTEERSVLLPVVP
ncbi:hypothetical protein HRbin21_01481 [bacterium HR21]|nr:hypothetical protein HRbin21_01481 [bacterium HR21]